MSDNEEEAKSPPDLPLIQIQNNVRSTQYRRYASEVLVAEKYLGPTFIAARLSKSKTLGSWIKQAVQSAKDKLDESRKQDVFMKMLDTIDYMKHEKFILQELVKDYLVKAKDKEKEKLPPIISEAIAIMEMVDTLIERLYSYSEIEGTPGEEKKSKEKLDGGRRTRRKRRRKKKHRTGIHMKRKTHKHKKKHRRKTKRKRRVKRRRKTTRKKRGRGMGPSKMAKVGVAALAASTAMGQGMGHGISPSRGTAAAVNHFKTVACSDFHIGDIVEHSEDHGQTTKHYRPVLQAALGKKKSCKKMGQPMRKPKPEKIKKNPNESGRQFKKRKREEKRKAKAAGRQAEEQERIEREVMEEMERERGESSTNTGSGQQQENTGYLDHLERVGKYTAAGLLAMEGVRRLGRPRGRGRGPRFARELTPERQRRR